MLFTGLLYKIPKWAPWFRRGVQRSPQVNRGGAPRKWKPPLPSIKMHGPAAHQVSIKFLIQNVHQDDLSKVHQVTIILMRCPLAGCCRNFLHRYRARHRNVVRQKQDVLAMKARYSPPLQQLALKSRAHALLKKLRSELGDSFLAETRLATAYKAQRSSLSSHYAML